MMELLVVFVAGLALSLGLLFGPVPPSWLYAPRWAQGWLVPHLEPRDDCRAKCARCRS